MISEEKRDEFISSIYDILSNEPTNEKANQIIDLFDELISNFIEIPCELGSNVYNLISCRNDKTNKLEPFSYLDEKVVGVHICDKNLRTNSTSNKKYSDYLIIETQLGTIRHIPFNKLGKSLFLSEEEVKNFIKNNKNL